MRRTLEARKIKNDKVVAVQVLGKVNIDEYGRISMRTYRENCRKIKLEAREPQSYIAIFCKETGNRIEYPHSFASFVKIL